MQMHVRSRRTRIDAWASITDLDDARVPVMIGRRWNYQNAMLGIVFIVPFLLQQSVRRRKSRLIRFVHCNARDPVGSGGGCGQARTADEMTFSVGAKCCDDNWAAYTNMFTGEICATIDDSRFQSFCFLFASRRFQSIDRLRKREGEKHTSPASVRFSERGQKNADRRRLRVYFCIGNTYCLSCLSSKSKPHTRDEIRSHGIEKKSSDNRLIHRERERENEGLQQRRQVCETSYTNRITWPRNTHT